MVALRSYFLKPPEWGISRQKENSVTLVEAHAFLLGTKRDIENTDGSRTS